MWNPFKRKINKIKTEIQVIPTTSASLEAVTEAASGNGEQLLNELSENASISIESHTQLDRNTTMDIEASINSDNTRVGFSVTRRF